jgi:hypothetical protein
VAPAGSSVRSLNGIRAAGSRLSSCQTTAAMVRHTVIALAALLMAAAAPAAANGPLNFPFPRMHADSRAPGGLMDRHSGGAASLQLRDNKFLATMAKAKVAVKETIDLDKYPKLFGAGGFCAAITHFVTVPLDVVKTRLQVRPAPFTRSARTGFPMPPPARASLGAPAGQTRGCLRRPVAPPSLQSLGRLPGDVQLFRARQQQ